MKHVVSTSPYRAFSRGAALLCVAALAAALTGCTLFGGEPASQTVADPQGLFHFKVPASWQVNVEQGLIAVYAAEEPPESSALDALSLVVLSASAEETTTAVAERVASIVAARAASRGWQEYAVGEAEDVAVGSRTGVRVEVSGTDADGVAFEGAYQLVRTSGVEVLVVAVSPEGRWAQDRESLDDIFEQWYWLRPETETPAP